MSDLQECADYGEIGENLDETARWTSGAEVKNMLLSEAQKQSLQPSAEVLVQRADVVGCNDCFCASLSAIVSTPLVDFAAQRFAPLAQVRLRSVRSGAPHRSNKSLQRTANSIKWQGPLPRRAAAELNR